MGQAVILILIFVALAGAFFWYRTTRRQPALASPRGKRDEYHCIEVKSGDEACEAVKGLATLRFLPDDAPRLPVSGCDAQQCVCRYRHYDDRRQEIRRHPGQRHRWGAPAESGERRRQEERRKSPEIAFDSSIGN
jgi:hypothetical protein